MMAQQAALRIHAARQGQGVVALHPLSHAQLRESDALTAVAWLSTLPLCDPAHCLAADDLRRVRDRVDVLMLGRYEARCVRKSCIGTRISQQSTSQYKTYI